MRLGFVIIVAAFVPRLKSTDLASLTVVADTVASCWCRGAPETANGKEKQRKLRGLFFGVVLISSSSTSASRRGHKRGLKVHDTDHCTAHNRYFGAMNSRPMSKVTGGWRVSTNENERVTAQPKPRPS